MAVDKNKIKIKMINYDNIISFFKHIFLKLKSINSNISKHNISNSVYRYVNILANLLVYFEYKIFIHSTCYSLSASFIHV